MHRSEKPVRKCHGCGLNFRDHCGVFENPHNMWHNHNRCAGYMNEQLLAEYNERLAREQTDLKKEKRREVAKQRRTQTRYDRDRHVLMSTRS